MRALWSERFPWSVTLVRRHVRRVGDYFLRHIGVLDPGDYVSIRYENLCGDPEGTVAKVVNFLGIRPAAFPDVRSLVQPRDLALLPDVQAHRGTIRRDLRPYCQYVGYDG